MANLIIHYKTSVHPERLDERNNHHEEYFNYKALEKKACCAEMGKCLNEEKVDFAKSSFEPSKPMACLDFTFGDDDFNSMADHEYMDIEFCPFCGQKISVSRRKGYLLNTRK